MRGIEFVVEWLEAPPEGEAFGPEAATWAALTICLDGSPLTIHHSADQPTSTEESAIVGGLSGLAEWLVECWGHLLWEVHTPFPRVPTPGGAIARIPGLRDAFKGWPDLDPEQVPRPALARWQHRHTLGHASSCLALPSLVFLPEERHIGLAVDHLPPQLDPAVRFTAPGRPWPAEPIWVAREDFDHALGSFLNQVLDHAEATDMGREWAQWLRGQWAAALERVATPEARRSLMFGEAVAQAWSNLAASLGARLPALQGILLDVAPPADRGAVDQFAELVRHETWPRRGEIPRVRSVAPLELLPFEQGYQLARALRHEIREVNGPFYDLSDTFSRLGIELHPIQARPPEMIISFWRP
ncbi:MAG: hypothetical protein RBU45_25545 [Myxococcota bacterium]|nr:hypothetical protein [Myxococcota bacterium]